MSDVIKFEKELALTLGSDSVQVSGRALVLGSTATYEEVEMAYLTAATMDQCTQWWIGDISLQGEEILGEKFHHMESVIAEKTGLDLDTIKRYRRTAKCFSPKERMAISFTHHQAVEKLEKKERKRLLIKSIDEGISANDLRKIVRAMTPSKKNGSRTYVLAQHNLRDSEIDMGTLYEKCADESNRTFTDEELHALGLADVNDSATVYIIIRKPTIDADEDDGKEVLDALNEEPEDLPEPEAPPEDMDLLVDCAMDFLKEHGKPTVGHMTLQRHLKIGVAKAQYLVQEMEDRGLLGEADESGMREVLATFQVEEKIF